MGRFNCSWSEKTGKTYIRLAICWPCVAAVIGRRMDNTLLPIREKPGTVNFTL